MPAALIAIAFSLICLSSGLAGEASNEPAPRLGETVYFDGAGMGGIYIPDMVAALREAGIDTARAARRARYSKGMMEDAWRALKIRSRDSHASDFSAFSGEGRQFNLVGYSYGGLVAAQLAADYAERGGRVDHLVLIATPADPGFLGRLKSQKNIGAVIVLDLTDQKDPLRAGGSLAEILASTPRLFLQLLGTVYGRPEGHFFYVGTGEKGKKRRRHLAGKLYRLGLR